MRELLQVNMDTAAGMLGAYKAAVQAIAASLCRSGTISGRWVRTLMARQTAEEAKQAEQ